MNQGQWRIGEVTVTRVVEIEATGGMTFILPQAKRDILKEIPWLYPHFADENGRMRGSIHALIIETPDRRIVVDTCIGNDKERGNPPWNQLQTTFLEDLTAITRNRAGPAQSHHGAAIDQGIGQAGR